ncbi:hypothetical protein QCA50_001650 [Cerrena zonata]|uniref:Period circadian protein n=1 Tax=Cerrena zonata TaxID=2478898 RepID=A0AAW0GXM7_9APHY
MRTPSLSVSFLTAAAILSPALVNAAPAATHHSESYSPSTHHHSSGGVPAASTLVNRGLGFFNDVFTRSEPTERTISAHDFWKRTVDTLIHHNKRVDDSQTQGGNAHSGNSGNVNGGSVYNPDTTMNEGMPTLMNMNSNNGGTGGEADSGCAGAGKSGSSGVGGNASSGNTGDAHGGTVSGGPSGMVNVDSNNAGNAGTTKTGCATGGSTHDATS